MVAAIKRNVDIFQDNSEKSSATMDTVCFSKRLTDKNFILYSQIGQEKIPVQQHFTRFWRINRSLAAICSKAEFRDGTRNVNKTHPK